MECLLKLTKQELMEILNVKSRTLEKMEKCNKLSSRLKDKGYELKKKDKEGRKVFYYIIKFTETDNKEILTNIIENIFKTRKYLTFSEYFTIRYVFAKMEWQGASISAISDKVGVSEQIIIKWDKILKEERWIYQEGYYYYKRDMNTGEELLISEWEYKSYWRNKAYVSAMNKLQKKYDNGEISFTELQVAILERTDILKAIEGKYCYKVKKYIIDEGMTLCGDVFNLIKKCYLTDVGLDYLKIHKK